jgi:prefoldin beta subunit
MSQQNQNNSDAERLVADYQLVQEQLRASALQLEQLQSQKTELERAKEEVSGASGKVYITVGGVIVETDKAKALEDIGSRMELTQVRIGSVTKQYNDMKAKEKLLGDKLTQLLGSKGPG